jgi:anhydro-N-acetylmuramic acid kinase
MTKEIKSKYKVIGIMAGSSMDGLDIIEINFSKKGHWKFEILKTQTYSYDLDIYKSLSNAADQNIENQKNIDVSFGEWIGEKCLDFGVKNVDLIAVHGHTVIHNPEKSISWQLGNGRIISEKTKAIVISGFRSQDVNNGGQGAPLVPVGDFNLFQEYNACLNLGGIANVSIRDERRAWDICPCNQVLNYYANKLEKDYDENGELARTGTPNRNWLKKIEEMIYFQTKPPKSLPNKFIDEYYLDKINPMDGLRSYSEFIANQISNELKNHLHDENKILVTGGGAFNSFLLELLSSKNKGLNFVVPENQLVEFKEALVFGFLGLLKIQNENNVLASVTGASRDSSSGIIHYPK